VASGKIQGVGSGAVLGKNQGEESGVV